MRQSTETDTALSDAKEADLRAQIAHLYATAWKRSPPNPDNYPRTKGRAKERFRGHDLTAEEWRVVCEKHGNVCAHCGGEGALTVDHIVSQADGGDSDPTNIQPLCKPCNSRKNGGVIARQREQKKQHGGP